MSNLPKGWEFDKLGNIATFFKGKGISKKDISNEGYDCIRYGELFTIYNEVITKIYSKTNSIEDMILSENNDTLMPTSDVTPRGLATASALSKSGVILGGDILIIRSNKLLNSYLSYYIRSHKSEIMKLVKGSTVYHIYANDMKNFQIFIPPLEEQKKIADILSTVDKKIAFVEENINATEELKKGLMQKLLTEGIGHTEFKDSELGRIPKSWEISNIGNIFNIFVGRDLKEDRFSKEKTDTHIFPVFSNTVDNNGFYGYYDYEEFNGSSLTVVGRGIGVGTAFTKNGSYGAIGRLLVLFPQKGIEPHFYTEYINFKIKIFSESSGIPQLTGAQIKNYKCPIPPLEVQKQISEILSTVDKKLENLKEKKLFFEELKKGLMQKLLTGEVRV